MDFEQTIRVLRRAHRRRETAKALRAKGWTHQRIADKLGISKQRVSQMLAGRS